MAKLLRAQDVARLLNVTLNTINNWRNPNISKHFIPYVKIHHTVRYRIEDVMKFDIKNLKKK